MVKDNSGKSLLIIECKTAGNEFDNEWKKTLINGRQIFPMLNKQEALNLLPFIPLIW